MTESSPFFRWIILKKRCLKGAHCNSTLYLIFYQDVFLWCFIYCESQNCICCKKQALSSDWPKHMSATVLCTFTGLDQLLRSFWEVAKLSLQTRSVFIHCFDCTWVALQCCIFFCELTAAASHQTELFRIWWSFRQSWHAITETSL